MINRVTIFLFFDAGDVLYSSQRPLHAKETRWQIYVLLLKEEMIDQMKQTKLDDEFRFSLAENLSKLFCAPLQLGMYFTIFKPKRIIAKFDNFSEFSALGVLQEAVQLFGEIAHFARKWRKNAKAVSRHYVVNALSFGRII